MVIFSISAKTSIRIFSLILLLVLLLGLHYFQRDLVGLFVSHTSANNAFNTESQLASVDFKQPSTTNAVTTAQSTVTAKKTVYVLQLMGSRSPVKLKRYLVVNGLQQSVQIDTKQYLGRPWYMLDYGEYGSYKAAKNALNSLPRKFKELQPWIKPLTK